MATTKRVPRRAGHRTPLAPQRPPAPSRHVAGARGGGEGLHPFPRRGPRSRPCPAPARARARAARADARTADRCRDGPLANFLEDLRRMPGRQATRWPGGLAPLVIASRTSGIDQPTAEIEANRPRKAWPRAVGAGRPGGVRLERRADSSDGRPVVGRVSARASPGSTTRERAREPRLAPCTVRAVPGGSVDGRHPPRHDQPGSAGAGRRLDDRTGRERPARTREQVLRGPNPVEGPVRAPIREEMARAQSRPPPDPALGGQRRDWRRRNRDASAGHGCHTKDRRIVAPDGEELAGLLKGHSMLGIGLRLGRRGPGWPRLIEIRTRNARGARPALRRMFDASLNEAATWSDEDGVHRIFVGDDRLADFGPVVGALGGDGVNPHYPGLEIRLGSGDPATSLAILPPTPSHYGKRREWKGHGGKFLPLPERFYADLARFAGPTGGGADDPMATSTGSEGDTPRGRSIPGPRRTGTAVALPKPDDLPSSVATDLEPPGTEGPGSSPPSTSRPSRTPSTMNIVTVCRPPSRPWSTSAGPASCSSRSRAGSATGGSRRGSGAIASSGTGRPQTI